METQNEIFKLLSEVKRDGMSDLLIFLKKSDYFTAPSSANHHGNFDGGLAVHSLNVFKLFNSFLSLHNVNLPRESRIITALLHDFCKIDFYKKGTKWRKDKNDRWEEYETYLYDDKMPLGHGEKSAMLIQRFIKLTDDEILLIRHHMGAFGLDYSGLRTYNAACDICPSIVLLHTADYQSSQFREEHIEK